MPVVSDVAMWLVGGNEVLLSNASGIIVGQDIYFAAPREVHEMWCASGQEQMSHCIERIVPFVDRWTLPLLNDMNDPEDLIRAHISGDNRILMQKRWYIYVAAAYIVCGNRVAARDVIETYLGAPGLRSRYAVVFDNVASA
jgi:hypothetical protein